MLLRYGGFTILTDPNFLHKHEVVRLGYGLRSKRLSDPALDIADLPPLDLWGASSSSDPATGILASGSTSPETR